MGCGLCTMQRKEFDSSQSRLNFNLHYRIDIQLMATLKQKKHLIQTIKTPEGFNPSKLKIEYVNADGFNVFNEIIYDDVPYYLEEDSTGKSSSFFVNAGENVQESQ